VDKTTSGFNSDHAIRQYSQWFAATFTLHLGEVLGGPVVSEEGQSPENFVKCSFWYKSNTQITQSL